MSEIDDLVAKIVQQIGGTEAADQTTATPTSTATQTQHAALSKQDYPLYSKHPELVHSPSGKALNDITLDNVLNDEIGRAHV